MCDQKLVAGRKEILTLRESEKSLMNAIGNAASSLSSAQFMFKTNLVLSGVFLLVALGFWILMPKAWFVSVLGGCAGGFVILLALVCHISGKKILVNKEMLEAELEALTKRRVSLEADFGE